MQPIAMYINITEYHTYGLPNRQLELQCEIVNDSPNDVCILDVWSRIDALAGFCIAEGRLFYSLHGLVDPAVVKARERGLGRIVVPLSPLVLSSIEDKRAGNDLIIRISSRALVSPVGEDDKT